MTLSYAAGAAEITTNQAASSVIGQSSFTTSDQSFTASTLWTPSGVAMDPTTGKVFVADRDNNRVLRYTDAAAYANGAAAEVAFGQTSLNAGGFNSPTGKTMNSPGGLTFDASGRLYVADTGFNRVLRFDTPSTTSVNGIAADLVFGQSSFTSSNAVVAAGGMNAPAAVAVGSNYLWVADSHNNRVLGFANPAAIISNGANASKVLGQSVFGAASAASPPDVFSMNEPDGVAVTGTGTLWVSDTNNNRLLRYTLAGNAVNGTAADAVLGQPDFTTAADASSATATNLFSPEGIVIDDSGTTTSLWVADRVLHRVLRYDDVANIANGAAATVVLGQPDFTSDDSDTTQNTMDQPSAVAIDTYHITESPRTIWVADTGNARVLRFTPQEPAPPVTSLPAGPTIGGATHYKTSKSKVTLKGSASGAAGLSAVQYKGKKGGFRNASGTTKWSFKAACKPGTNRFTVVAVDALGRPSAPLTIVVKRAR